MTLTLEQIHALPDDKLCEAISEVRESREKSTNAGCNWWVDDKYVWHPADWLIPENWTRLQEEKKIDAVHFEGHEEWFALLPEQVYTMNINLGRAVCEAWLYLNQEEK